MMNENKELKKRTIILQSDHSLKRNIITILFLSC